MVLFNVSLGASLVYAKAFGRKHGVRIPYKIVWSKQSWPFLRAVRTFVPWRAMYEHMPFLFIPSLKIQSTSFLRAEIGPILGVYIPMGTYIGVSMV